MIKKQKLSKRIRIADLSEFDAAPYLNNERAMAAYLTDILQANDAGLLAATLGDIARARGESCGLLRSIGFVRR